MTKSLIHVAAVRHTVLLTSVSRLTLRKKIKSPKSMMTKSIIAMTACHHTLLTVSVKGVILILKMLRDSCGSTTKGRLSLGEHCLSGRRQSCSKHGTSWQCLATYSPSLAHFSLSSPRISTQALLRRSSGLEHSARGVQLQSTWQTKASSVWFHAPLWRLCH